MDENLSSRIKHIAIISDGNRRWAAAHGYHKLLGHKYGGENIVKIALELVKRGIPYVTFFIFSAENSDRERAELEYMLQLLKRLCNDSFLKLHEAGCKINFIGYSRVINGYDLSPIISEVEEKTKNNQGTQVCFCLNYGGRQEIVEAAKRCIEKKIPAGKLTMELFREQMSVPNVPDPDILIRTSGEMRISNFLLWQLAYTEMFFVKECWPDFSVSTLDSIIEEFLKRDRRYGL